MTRCILFEILIDVRGWKDFSVVQYDFRSSVCGSLVTAMWRFDSLPSGQKNRSDPVGYVHHQRNVDVHLHPLMKSAPWFSSRLRLTTDLAGRFILFRLHPQIAMFARESVSMRACGIGRLRHTGRVPYAASITRRFHPHAVHPPFASSLLGLDGTHGSLLDSVPFPRRSPRKGS